MIVLCFLFAVSVVHGIRRVEHVVVDYAGGPNQGQGWITLKLDDAVVGSKTASITKIEWCKSTTPNPVEPTDVVPTDISACKGYGLMHLELYPSKRALVRTPKEEPNTVYIDPANIGGWDMRHQFDVIVHARVDEETDIVQVVRFNPLIRPTTNLRPPTEKPPIEKPTTDKPSTEKPTDPSIVVFVEPTVSAVEPPARYSWRGALSVFGIGLLVLTLLGLVHYGKMSSWSVRKLKRYVDQKKRTYGLVRGDGAIEMEFIDGSHDDDKKENHLHILTRIGSGATPAFMANLNQSSL
jgi:hypothetical protein